MVCLQVHADTSAAIGVTIQTEYDSRTYVYDSNRHLGSTTTDIKSSLYPIQMSMILTDVVARK